MSEAVFIFEATVVIFLMGVCFVMGYAAGVVGTLDRFDFQMPEQRKEKNDGF